MKFILKYPWIILLVVICITVFLGIQILNLKVSGSITDFIPHNHPSSKADARIKTHFNPGQRISIIMTVDDISILNANDLNIVNAITDEIETIPAVKEVLSLANAQYIKGEPGGFRVVDIIDKTPVETDDIEQIKQNMLSSFMFEKLLYSQDLKTTQIIVTLYSTDTMGKLSDIDEDMKNRRAKMEISDFEYQKAFASIKKIIGKFEDKRISFHIAGDSVIEMMLINGIKDDLVILFPILLILLLIILFIAFRTIRGMVLPLLTVLLSCCWTTGIMALFGIKFTIMGTTIPILLMAVGSAYGIHYLTHYYESLAGKDKNKILNREENNILNTHSIKKVGKPIILAGLTTVAGFGSLASSSITAIRDMGIFTAVGVACALILTLTFVPVCLVLGPVKKRVVSSLKTGNKKLLNFISNLYSFFTKGKYRVFLFLILVLIVSLIGIQHIKIGQPTINFFKPESPVRKADSFANRNLSGTTLLQVMISAAEESYDKKADREKEGAETDPASDMNDLFDMDFEELTEDNPTGMEEDIISGFKDPDILVALDSMIVYLKSKYSAVGKITSFTDMIKEMNRAMHIDTGIHGGDAYFEIPSNPEKYGKKTKYQLQKLISQYLVLYSGNLHELIDDMDNPGRTLINILITDNDPSFVKQVNDEINRYFKDNIQPLGYTLDIGGPGEKFLALNELIVKSQIITIVIALIVVFLIMFISFRSFVAGVVGIIPIGFALALNFAVMGYLGIPLDIVTALIASISIGIGIDYSIHVMSAFKFELSKGGIITDAVNNVIKITGKAIIYNALSVAAGFAVLVFSLFVPLNNAGILICITMFSSSFLALTILPALISIIKPEFIDRNYKIHKPCKGVLHASDEKEHKKR